MLVIVRKVGESFTLTVDNHVIARVFTYEAANGRSKIGIDAIPAVNISRDELNKPMEEVLK